MNDSTNSPKAFIHQSEMDMISRWVMDFPDLETGGDFFGSWSKDGNPVVQYVTGPGEKATRTSTSFYQDIPYLKKCGALLNSRYGVEHIGGWHSHHRLSLTHPSSGDVNTMRNALRDNNLPRFLISICNIENNSGVNINGFLFSRAYEFDYLKCKWIVLEGVSPIRESLEKRDSDLFISPRSKVSHTYRGSQESSESKDIKLEKPELSENSYWATTQGRDYLKMVFEKLKRRNDLSHVELLQLSDKRIAISFNRDKAKYEIRFPNDFPSQAPELVEKTPVSADTFIPFFKRKSSTKKHTTELQDFFHSLDILDGKKLIVITFA